MLLVRHLRLKRGWTQREVAEQLGTFQSHISDYERGIRKPNDALLQRLAQLLDVSPAYRLLLPVTIVIHEPGEGVAR